MPLRLSKPLVEEFFLTETDKAYPNTEDSKPTKISVRQATTGDIEIRGALFSKFKRTFDAMGNFSIEQEVTMDDVRRKEVFLTLVSCNIVNENGKPLFKFDGGRLADEMEFERGWALLPPLTADEIHRKVLEHNPPWGPQGEHLSNKKEKESETVLESTLDSSMSSEPGQPESSQ